MSKQCESLRARFGESETEDKPNKWERMPMEAEGRGEDAERFYKQREEQQVHDAPEFLL